MTANKLPALVLCLVGTLTAGCNMRDAPGDAEHNSDALADSAPSIWGDPGTTVEVGSQYVFQPEAEDGDGDVLEFSIVHKPAWAAFDAATGTLSGIPTEANVGTYADVVISVSDQNSVASLPSFSITVASAGDSSGTGDGGAASSPPTISGKPNSEVVAGKHYAFQPDASDPDDDPLSFSIVNKPAWASFDTTSGRLEGQPTADDIGEGKPIEISVTDGASVAALARFAITVDATGSTSLMLGWTPPTENDDGSPLTDLAAYRIYYGMVPGEYSERVDVNSPGVSSYVVDNLAPGRYFLTMKSIDSSDLESDYATEVAVEAGP